MQRLELSPETVEAVVVVLVTLLAGRGARVRRRVGGGRARRARGTRAAAAAAVDRAVETVSIDLQSDEGKLLLLQTQITCIVVLYRFILLLCHLPNKHNSNSLGLEIYRNISQI